MGCDGGSIPRRDELVKLKKKAEKVDPNEIERIKWFTCAMSNEKLKEPVVVCELGHLYNKEAVITALLNKNMDEKFSHIRNLKDLISPRFTANPAFNASATDTDNSASRSPFICPISQVEVGHYPFNIIKTCGCVLSERALREVPSTACLQCGSAFTPEDVIAMNPSPDVRAELRTRMDTRRAQEKGKKKEKRDKKEKRREKKEKEGEKKEGESKEKEESVSVGKGSSNGKGMEKDLAVSDKKGKKREVESLASIDIPPTKSSKLSTTTTTTTTTTSTSSSASSSSTTKTTATYTASVAPHSGERPDNESELPSTITVAKTAAYNSIFNPNRKQKGANSLFSGIY